DDRAPYNHGDINSRNQTVDCTKVSCRYAKYFFSIATALLKSAKLLFNKHLQRTACTSIAREFLKCMHVNRAVGEFLGETTHVD
ncbi:MAG: hypothetical protein ABI876_14595, partial [Bacteroidota bacterium]